VIRIITEPTVAVIARTNFAYEGIQPYLDSIGAPDWQSDARTSGDVTAEVAGRVCYRSFANPRPGGNAAYLAHILESGHGSVLEHASWTLLFTGISRNLTHEFVRHRAGFAYSQRSQRYCDDSDIGFVVPPALLGDHAEWADHREENARYKAAIGDWDHGLRRSPAASRFEEWWQARDANVREYQGIFETIPADGLAATASRKAAREAARSVLPGCTATELVATANARAWRTLLEQRGSLHAEAEFRRLSLAILATLKTEAPNIFSDFKVRTENGIDHIHAQHRKV
jgi:thymidylate synthase (FAD)